MVLANEQMHKSLTRRRMAEILNLRYSTYCEYANGKNLFQQILRNRLLLFGKNR